MLKVDRLVNHTPRFWCVEAKFQWGLKVSQSMTTLGMVIIRESKKNIGAQLMADGQLFQILFLEKQLRQNYGDLFFFEKMEWVLHSKGDCVQVLMLVVGGGQ